LEVWVVALNENFVLMTIRKGRERNYFPLSRLQQGGLIDKMVGKFLKSDLSRDLMSCIKGIEHLMTNVRKYRELMLFIKTGYSIQS